MGKPTGFIDYERVDSEAVKPKNRIKNFNEFHTPLTIEEQRQQAARCMDAAYRSAVGKGVKGDGVRLSSQQPHS